MSKVIIFCGSAGSGKSTLATEISKRTGVFCLHKDAVKERLYEYLGGGSLEESRRLGFHSIRLILDLAEDAVRNGVDIIVEAPFNHPENVGRFQSWVDSGCDVRVIVCRVDEKVRERRYRNRPRHQAHHDSEREFSEDTFDYASLPGEKLVLDTGRPIEDIIDEAISFLS